MKEVVSCGWWIPTCVKIFAVAGMKFVKWNGDSSFIRVPGTWNFSLRIDALDE